MFSILVFLQTSQQLGHILRLINGSAVELGLQLSVLIQQIGVVDAHFVHLVAVRTIQLR
jgi:hypothetical protein